MTQIVFVGPSLEPADWPAFDDLNLRPPVRQGDVLRAVRAGATAIGIVDGYFDSVPAVWHKEILWAMAEGVPVYGGSSMGALRAAELHQYGMIGVGKVFEWYRDDVFWQDDAVALIHGPEELGYPKLSEPLVNIHATTQAAVRQAVIDAEFAGELVATAQSLFYKERDWDRIIDSVTDNIDQFDRFRKWLAEGYVDQKRIDALALLHKMRADAHHPNVSPTDFAFEWTDVWDRLYHSTGAEAPHADAETGDHNGLVLDELRLEPASYRRIKIMALPRVISRIGGPVRDDVDSDGRLATELTALRAELGLFQRTDMNDWLKRNDLRPDVLSKVLSDRVALQEFELRYADQLANEIIDELKVDGSYATLADRAAAKQALLAEHGLDKSQSSEGLPPPQLVDWYHDISPDCPPPNDLDRHCREIGLDNRQEWYRILQREYHFLRLRQ